MSDVGSGPQTPGNRLRATGPRATDPGQQTPGNRPRATDPGQHDPGQQTPGLGAPPGRRRLQRFLLLPVVTNRSSRGVTDMSVTDELLANNERYAESLQRPAAAATLGPPRRGRVHGLADEGSIAILGLEEGQAHIIRNAGGVVTDDEIRSLAISQRLLGTRSIILIHHTECGMLTFTDDQFKASHRAGDGDQAGMGGGGLHRPGRGCPAVDCAGQGRARSSRTPTMSGASCSTWAPAACAKSSKRGRGQDA